MVVPMTDGSGDTHIAHCSACGCRMDISAMGPYTNVICPNCGHHTRVKCDLGQYLLVGRHAAGGMSMVFDARDTTLERKVAIKVLNEEYSKDEKRMEQFEQEALITAAISHPHVVRVFTVGMQYGRYYIAMEKVSGENLEQKISREDAIKEDEILPMTEEIISGLRAAKRAGLIHRDIKPGNILFDAMGHVKIVDFGLALVTQGGKAKAEEIWATPYYVPPEALDGREEDFRSDIYALGATLYHALSGQPSIGNDVQSTQEVRKAKENVLPLGQVAPWLSSETCYLVDKAMALAPGERFQSYAEMEEAWQAAYQAVQGQGASEPIHSRERAHRRAKKEFGSMGLIVAGIVALVLVVGGLSLFVFDRDEDEPSAPMMSSGEMDGSYEPGGSHDPAVAARIAGMVKSSHARLRDRRYNEARDIFARMMRDSDVSEPAASWAGVESVIATWLEGDSRRAAHMIGEVQKHMKRRNVSEKDKVKRLVDQLTAPNPISSIAESKDSMGVVQLMAVALKNWEMDAWDAALPLFERVTRHVLPEGSPFLVYRDIARRYLGDHKTLQPYEKVHTVESIPDTVRQLDVLKKLPGSLKTRGRAHFYVHVRQKKLEDHIKDLQAKARALEEERNRPPLLASVMPQFHALVGQAKYFQATQVLQRVTMEKHERDMRNTWLYLANSAGGFLQTLEKVIPDTGVQMEVVDIKGKKYQRIVNSRPGGLMLKGSGGDQFVAWSHIQPESVLAIHTKAYKRALSTADGQRRTEQAICYLWLTGMKDKAKSAAAKLSEANPDFGKRWGHTIRVQGEKK